MVELIGEARDDFQRFWTSSWGADQLVVYDPLISAITDFLQITTSGSNSIVKVDRDGTGTSYALSQISTIEGVTGLTDEQALLMNGNLIVA